MARRDVLLGITKAASDAAPSQQSPSGYAIRGASRSMLSSIGELAARAEKLSQGTTITEIDPDLIDQSFVLDRIDADDAAFQELLVAIREKGQESPILVRPHPRAEGRYMVVFGHRRLNVAKQLGRPVRAIVKSMADIDHVVAQGQENSARENLSFVERAVFAHQLIELGYDRPTVQAALAVDAPMLTRMLSVTKRVPMPLIRSIGAAKGIGRDRWLELVTLMDRPGAAERALERTGDSAFNAKSSDDRFMDLIDTLKSAGKGKSRARKKAEPRMWAAKDARVSVSLTKGSKSSTVVIGAADGARFAAFLVDNLDELYAKWKSTQEN